LIRAVHAFSQRPEFEGKVLLLEAYDLALARHLLAGVDLWLNTPQYPLEASGTSGMKAGINGVPQLSVLDGWWAEGFDGENGWAISPHLTPDKQPDHAGEAHELFDILEHEIVPLYFERRHHVYPAPWIKKAKTAMKTSLQRFSSERMVLDYARKFYQHAASQNALFGADNSAAAAELARWKRQVTESWRDISLRLVNAPPRHINAGERLHLEVNAKLGKLAANDVVMECLVDPDSRDGTAHALAHTFEFVKLTPEGETLFTLDLCPDFSGVKDYRLRLYPSHRLLSHRFELGLMKWV
jgi:starch phosphorylase